jgi:hypothetical protein
MSIGGRNVIGQMSKIEDLIRELQAVAKKNEARRPVWIERPIITIRRLAAAQRGRDGMRGRMRLHRTHADRRSPSALQDAPGRYGSSRSPISRSRRKPTSCSFRWIGCIATIAPAPAGLWHGRWVHGSRCSRFTSGAARTRSRSGSTPASTRCGGSFPDVIYRAEKLSPMPSAGHCPLHTPERRAIGRSAALDGA